MCNAAWIDLPETERLLKVYANPTITIQKSSMQYYTIKPSSPRSSPLMSVGLQLSKWEHQLESEVQLRAHV